MTSRRSTLDIIGVAAGVVLVATCLAIAAAIAAASLRLSATAAIALVAPLAPLAVSRYARRALGPRGPIYAAATSAVLAPFVFLGAASVLSEPILHDFRCGMGMLGFVFVAPVLLALVGTPVATATWLVVGGDERPRLDRAVRVVAIAATVGAVVLFAFAAARRAQRPDADGYIAQLPIVTELKKEHFREIALSELPPDNQFSGPPLTHAYRADIPGGPAIYRACRDEGECRLWTRGRSDVNAKAMSSWARFDMPLAVRHDARNDLYVLEGAAPRAAIQGDGRVRLPLYPRDVSDSLAAPRAWIVVAALGALVAIAFLRRGRATERRATAIAWREGFVTGNGTVVFADGASVGAPSTLVEGSSVTVAATALETTTFRTLPELSEQELRPGTIEDRAAEARAEGTREAARALMVIALTSAPLVACIVHGVAF